MSKKFSMDKEDARIVNAHIRKIQKGPKERSRPRSRAATPVSLRNEFEAGPSYSTRISPVLETISIPSASRIEVASQLVQSHLITIAEASTMLNMATLDTFPSPEDSVIRIAMTQEQYAAEVHIAQRLGDWIPQYDGQAVTTLARKLRRTMNVRSVSPAPVFANYAITPGDENYLRMPICFKFFNPSPPGEENAVEINIGTVLSWCNQVWAGEEPVLDFSQGVVHRCGL